MGVLMLYCYYLVVVEFDDEELEWYFQFSECIGLWMVFVDDDFEVDEQLMVLLIRWVCLLVLV